MISQLLDYLLHVSSFEKTEEVAFKCQIIHDC